MSSSSSRFAIFNSFPFHYEMFGYIIEYCQARGGVIDIFTETANNIGWIQFYENKFPGAFRMFSYLLFNPINNYECVFLTTDDDPQFRDEWFNEKTLCIDHYYEVRRLYAGNRRVSTRPFISGLDWVLPVYKMVDVEEKRSKMVPGQIVCIGSNCPKTIRHVDTMIRHAAGLGENLMFICVERYLTREVIDCCYPNVVFSSMVDTSEMLRIVVESEYVYISENDGCYIKNKMSGVIPLAVSCLCKIIMPEEMNMCYQFGSAITYGLLTGDVPCAYDYESVDSMKVVCDEFEHQMRRKSTVFDKFVRKIPRIIFQTWESKDFEPEFQAIVDIWKKLNPSYKYVIHDKLDREEFIRAHFPVSVYNAYCKIVPGAFKADLWRYCVLYIHGGVYTDVDMLCMGKLDDFISCDTDMVVPVDLNTSVHEGCHNLSNGFFAVKPRCEILLQCITRIVHNVMNDIIPASLLDVCGPGMLGRATNIVLGREETASFIGMEGHFQTEANGGHTIHFLKFDRETEYMQDVGGNVILQNKNKNPEIQRLYRIECQKVNTICWIGTKPY